MCDVKGTVIYIGKAKNLRRRVSSYFNRTHADAKTAAMVAQIAQISYIATQNEQEALVLENQLIKKWRPKYNILLKDDKNYPYLKLTTGEPFPKLLVTRNRDDDRAEYFGPFPFMGSIHRFRQTILSLFPIRDCLQPIDEQDMQKKCIKLDLEKCIGPCVIKSVKPQYDMMIRQIRLLLKGKNRQLIGELRAQMKQLADEQRFERAAQIRDSIQKIDKIQQRQTVDIDFSGTVHVWAVSERDDLVYGLVQEIVGGKLLAQTGFYADKEGQEWDDFLLRSCTSYLQTTQMPDEIWCDSSLAVTFQNIVDEFESKRVTIVVPEIGKKRTIVQTAQLNARLSAARLVRSKPVSAQLSQQQILTHLQEALGLKRLPNCIVGFDISHLSASNIVASAVFFANGKPLKSRYRKFNIRSVSGKSHDPQSMYEVVLRRIHRDLAEGETLPDLLLIDGGIAQLNFALAALNSLPISQAMDIVSLAKREELVHVPGRKEPVRLSHHDAGLQLLQHVRDEAHRFALRFQRQKRAGWLSDSVLNNIPGLGKKRIQLLWSRYKTIEHIRALPVEELAKIGNMGRICAQNILDTLQQS